MKKLLVPIALIVAIIAGVAVWLVNSLDGIVKDQIEIVGSELTGVTVTVDSVKISLGDGTGTINGLTIANPDGYVSESAMKMGRLELQIDINSLAGDPLVLNKLVVDSLAANLELGKDSTNLSDITRNISNNTKSAEQETQETEAGKPFKIAINELIISNTTMQVHNGREASTETLPTITLSGIGGTTGATAAQVAGAIMTRLVSEILKEAAAERLMKTVGDAVDDMARGLLDSLNKALE